ncbi:hypothetical protein LCGC14_1140340 [marine sediment metagenome]|uniref:Uncharacterized protein n=1 Tax=marine sediment metagenome TaxID=412755 RepID=A0A0F9LYE5_9ZZZZ
MASYKVLAEGPGIGDALWLTALARNLKVQCPGDNIVTVSGYPTIFDNSPDVTKAVRFNEKVNGDFREIELHFNFTGHAIDGYCRQLGLKPPYIRRNFMYLDEGERYYAHSTIKEFKKVIAIQSQAGPWTRNKDWIPEYLNEVVKHFVGLGWRFMQVGGEDSVRLKNCYDFWGSVRQTAALMSECKLFLGPVSSGMHLASAVNIPALIIFGGREDPKVIALEGHDYIYNEVDCAPCWKIEPCGDKKCMDEIKPSLVIKYIEEMLVR